MSAVSFKCCRTAVHEWFMVTVIRFPFLWLMHSFLSTHDDYKFFLPLVQICRKCVIVFFLCLFAASFVSDILDRYILSFHNIAVSRFKVFCLFTSGVLKCREIVFLLHIYGVCHWELEVILGKSQHSRKYLTGVQVSEASLLIEKGELPHFRLPDGMSEISQDWCSRGTWYWKLKQQR